MMSPQQPSSSESNVPILLGGDHTSLRVVRSAGEIQRYFRMYPEFNTAYQVSPLTPGSPEEECLFVFANSAELSKFIERKVYNRTAKMAFILYELFPSELAQLPTNGNTGVIKRDILRIRAAAMKMEEMLAETE